MRKLTMIAGGLVLLVITVLMALSIFVDADRFRPSAEQQATTALGRQVTIGKLKLALFSGGIEAEKLSVADDPQFSKDPFVTAGSITIGVDLPALIFHRTVNVQSFLLHAPMVNVVQNAKGEWNYSTLGAKKTEAAPASAPGGPAPGFTLGKFLLDDGQVSVLHLSNGRTNTYSKLTLEATDITLSGAIPYTLTAVAPGGGTVEAKGNFGPLTDVSERTPMSASVHVKGFDAGAAGFIAPNSSLKGLVDLDGDLKSDGTRGEIDAKIIGNKMCLVAGCAPANKPIGLNLEANYLLADKLANLNNTQVKLGNSVVDVTGTVDLKPVSPEVNARLDANSLAVSDIEGVLPAVGVVLPPGARLEGGSANVHATANGPADALTVKAHVVLTNSKLTGYDLNSKMSVVTHLTGVTVNKETPIQEFAADVTQNTSGTKVDNLVLIMPGLARLTGSGTISSRNELNFAMKAQVDISGSAVGKIDAAFGKKSTNVPVAFHVTGTTDNPKITPELGVPGAGVATLVAGKTKAVTGGLSGLGGLFGKKKQ